VVQHGSTMCSTRIRQRYQSLLPDIKDQTLIKASGFYFGVIQTEVLMVEGRTYVIAQH
jgi:hypothetical protein